MYIRIYYILYYILYLIHTYIYYIIIIYYTIIYYTILFSSSVLPLLLSLFCSLSSPYSLLFLSSLLFSSSLPSLPPPNPLFLPIFKVYVSAFGYPYLYYQPNNSHKTIWPRTNYRRWMSSGAVLLVSGCVWADGGLLCSSFRVGVDVRCYIVYYYYYILLLYIIYYIIYYTYTYILYIIYYIILYIISYTILSSSVLLSSSFPFHLLFPSPSFYKRNTSVYV